MKSLNSEVIRALIPIFLTSTGGLIALVLILSAIVSPNGDQKLSDGKWASAMGLAGTAIGGAAGLAQSQKGESEIKTRNSNSESTETKTTIG
ncbi:MAG TPA: hypothetical protein VL134_07965 [Leptolyngbya sp.]|nr:hypothetical protein [Leptolyngbya sp.]